jgi:O-antigen ligase/tetratricopeptide (TPR) repeat protein
MTDKILRGLVLIGVFAIPVVIPFIVSSSMFFPFITGKGFTFRIITEIIFAAWFILALRNKDYRPKKSWILYALGAFLGIMLLADIFAENPQKAFWSNFERMEGYITLLHLAVYFIVASSTLITEKLWRNFFRLNILASIAMSCYSFLQLAGKITINQGGVRLDGTFGNATYLAGYALIMIFLALFLFIKESNKWWKGIYSLSVIFNLIVLYSTATRGALLGLIGGLILTAVLIAIFEKENRPLRKISLGVAIAVILLSGFFYAIRDTKFVQSHPSLSRLTSVSTDSADAKARFMVWGMALQGAKERPILGWGQEGFNFVFNKYYNPNMYNREQWFDRTHSILFDWLIAGGILGFLGYYSLLVLFFLFTWGWKKLPPAIYSLSITEKAILTGLGASYFFQNIFVFDNIVSYVLFFSLLAYLHQSRAKPVEKFESLPVVSAGDAYRFYGPIILVVLIVIIWFTNARNIFAANDLIRALSPQSEGLSKNLEYFKSALNRHSFADQEIREQLSQAAAGLATSNNQSFKAEDKSAIFSLALSEAKKQVAKVPTDTRGRVFLGSLYSLSGSVSDALKQFEEALKLSPGKQVIKESIASIYLQTGQSAQAESLMKSAYESAPQFGEVGTVYAVTAIYVGDSKTASQVLEKIYGTDEPLNNQILQAYLDTKQFDKALRIAKAIFNKDPNNLQNEILLASVYLSANMRNSAVSTLQDAIARNPSFKVQGESYIKEIQAGRNH